MIFRDKCKAHRHYYVPWAILPLNALKNVFLNKAEGIQP